MNETPKNPAPNTPSAWADPPIEVRDARRHTFFTIDDELIDLYASKIGVYSLAIYVALARHANQSSTCWPSLTTLSKKMGMSRPSVIKALNRLIEHKMITRQQRKNAKGEHTSNLYTLLDIKRGTSHPPEKPAAAANTAPPPDGSTGEKGGSKPDLPGSQPDLPPGKPDLPPGSKPDLPGGKRGLPEVNTQKETQEQKKTQTTTTTESRANKEASETVENVVVVGLSSWGISQNVAQFLAEQHKPEKITEKIEFLEFILETDPQKVKSPAGWLRRAIEENWDAPNGFLSKAEQERREEERRLREREILAAEEARWEERLRFQKMEEEARASLQQKFSEKFGTSEEEGKTWEQVLRQVKGCVDVGIYTLLEKVVPLKFGEGQALLGVPGEHVQAQFTHPGIRQFTQDNLSRVAGRTLELEFVVFTGFP